MAKSRISSSVLSDDTQIVDAISEMNDYKPFDTTLSYESLNTARQTMLAKQAIEDSANRAARAARDEAVDAELEFHDLITKSKTAIKGQYGADSRQVQAIGLKRKSEITRGRRKGNEVALSNGKTT